MALTSLASGFAGATTAVLGRGAFTASSRAGLKELYTKALKKKKLDQTLSPEEEVILQTSKSISRYGFCLLLLKRSLQFFPSQKSLLSVRLGQLGQIG